MNIVKNLVDKHEMAKYRIAKIVGVSWNTVQNWYKNIYIPTEENQKKIKKLLRKIIPLILLLTLIPACSPAFAITASWYSVESCKREGTSGIMANGKEFKNDSLVCASWDYSFGTRLRITNLSNNKCVVVTVSDRGPFGIQPAGYRDENSRVIDLSKKAFSEIASLESGIIKVQIEVL